MLFNTDIDSNNNYVLYALLHRILANYIWWHWLQRITAGAVASSAFSSNVVVGILKKKKECSKISKSLSAGLSLSPHCLSVNKYLILHSVIGLAKQYITSLGLYTPILLNTHMQKKKEDNNWLFMSWNSCEISFWHTQRRGGGRRKDGRKQELKKNCAIIELFIEQKNV